MKKSSLLGAVCVCLAIVSLDARAALVSVDLQTPGDNLITRDTDTGLEWLDLTETANLSYNYVSSQLASGGMFEGWTYASSTQAESLFDSAGGTGPYTGSSSVNNGVVAPLLNLWGDLTGFTTSNFLIAEQFDATYQYRGLVMDDTRFPQFLTEDVLNATNNTFNKSSSDVSIGSALVRVQAVPVPATAWLFGSGLLGLIGIARRKKAA